MSVKSYFKASEMPKTTDGTVAMLSTCGSIAPSIGVNNQAHMKDLDTLQSTAGEDHFELYFLGEADTKHDTSSQELYLTMLQPRDDMLP